ncbi:MAG: sigma-70 family RNA polymerase sigma factor [Verrucomicrobiales bacterium]
MNFPSTSFSLLSKLKQQDDSPLWQASWKRFLELYHEPLTVVARSCYRHHTGGQEPSPGFVEDAVADAIADFFSRSQHRYDGSKGRLRSYLRMITNARVVDLLRKERPIDHRGLEEANLPEAPEESDYERSAFQRSLLALLIEDLRGQIPMRQFEIFERVKLKHESPEYIAEDLAISRAMVDRYIYKAMTKLRGLAQQPDYQHEMED